MVARQTKPARLDIAYALAACLGGMGLSACADAPLRPVGARPVETQNGTLPAGPASPEHGLPFPSLASQWSPPRVVAGDVDALRAALQGQAEVEVRLGSRLQGQLWQERAEQLVRSIAPNARVVSGPEFAAANTFAALEGRPMTRVGDRPVWSAPQYDGTALQIETPPTTGTLMVVDDAEFALEAWQALPAHAVGTCEPAFDSLAKGQEQSLAYLEPFLDHADALLWQVYRATLQALLPRISDELGTYAELKTRAQFSDNGAWETYQCGHAYWEYLQNFTTCGDDPKRCPAAPRVYLVGGARIGSAEPSFFVDERCPMLLGRDYQRELRDMAVEAAQVASERLDPQWSRLAGRLGTVTEVHAALEDVCTPRRRRFDAADVDEVRRRLTEIGSALQADAEGPLVGRWSISAGRFHVPGVGPVQQVAWYEPGRGTPTQDIVAQSRALRQFALSRAMCRSGYRDVPLVVFTVPTGRTTPSFAAYFYEEELFCADLPAEVAADGQAEPASEASKPTPPG